MNSLRRRIICVLALLAVLPVFAQSPDLAGKRLHFFPLIAHGSDFHTILFLANDAHGANQCTLDLRGSGLDSGSFYPHQRVVWSGERAKIEFDADYPSLRMISRIGRNLAFGYANLDCAGPVFARVSLSLYESSTIVGTAVVPDSQRGANFSFPALPQAGSLGLVFSNDSGSDASCAVQLKNGRGETLARNSFTVGRYSTSLRFLDELTAIPRGFTGGSAAVACNTRLGAVGLPFNAPVFSSIASVLPQGDAAAKRRQFIPLVADGDGFRTHILVTNSARSANRCALDLQGEGLDNDRFEGLDASSATFELDGPGAQATIASTGVNALAFGYARLECDGAIVARGLLSAETADRFMGMATVPGVPAVKDFRFPVLPRSGEFALLFANGAGADIDCSLWLDDYRNEILDNTSLTVPMHSLELRFIDELFEIAERSSVFSAHASCDGAVAAMGMPLHGALFSTVPPLLIGPPDRTVTAPLLLDAAGCSNGLFVNDAALAGDCRVLVDFANTLIEGGSTADDLPVRQWGRGGQVRDVMSYCTEIDFISDYHYEKAWDYWRGNGTYSRSRSVASAVVTADGTAGTAPVAGGAGAAPPSATPAAPAEATRSLALSGGISAEGVWSLGQAQVSERGPRPPPEYGEYTLILFDSAGAQVYEEPLAPVEIGDSDDSFWAARTPLPPRTTAEIVILDPRGNEVLRQTLPTPQ